MSKINAEESGGPTLDCFSVKDQNIMEHDYILATEKIVKNTPSLYGRWEKICSSVELRESGRHGRGLFAAYDIPAYHIVTFYPVHWLSYNSGETRRTIKIGGKSVAPPPSIHADYTININEPKTSLSESIIGDPRICQPGWMGHMMNDVDSISMQPTQKEIREYCETHAIANVVPITVSRLRIALVSVRDISKDEEILFSYGPSYWAGFERTGSREIETSVSQAIIRNYVHENDNVIQMVCRGISKYNENLSQTIAITRTVSELCERLHY